MGWPWLCDSSHGRIGPLQRPGRRSRRRLHSCKWRGTRTEPAQCRRLVNFRIVSPASVDRAAGGRLLVGTAAAGLDSVSVTTLATPATCCRLLVYSAMYESCLCCLAVQGSDWRRSAVMRGLWSVNTVKRRPSSIYRK